MPGAQCEVRKSRAKGRVKGERKERGGCVAAAFFMAVSLFVGAERVGKARILPAFVKIRETLSLKARL